MKRKLKIYTSYGKQDNEILSDEKMFSSQKELDCYLDEAYNTETQSEYIYSDGGDWDDQTGFTYELVSYESELNEINKEIEKLKAKTENLMKEYN